MKTITDFQQQHFVKKNFNQLSRFTASKESSKSEEVENRKKG